jgi:hypothetical protein
MLMERTTLRDTCWWDDNLTLHWCCGTTPPWAVVPCCSRYGGLATPHYTCHGGLAWGWK